jgi:hypothetical protein
VPVCILEDL